MILRKIIKIVATRCHILRLKCTKFDFSWDPAGEFTALPQTTLLDLRGPTSKGRRGRERNRGMGGGRKDEEEGVKGERKGGRRKGGGGCVMVLGEWTPLAIVAVSRNVSQLFDAF